MVKFDLANSVILVKLQKGVNMHFIQPLVQFMLCEIVKRHLAMVYLVNNSNIKLFLLVSLLFFSKETDELKRF